MKISELNHDKKGHLIFLLDKHTWMGIGTAGSIARGDKGDMDIYDVFNHPDFGNLSTRSSKLFARRVIEFTRPPLFEVKEIHADDPSADDEYVVDREELSRIKPWLKGVLKRYHDGDYFSLVVTIDLYRLEIKLRD